MGVVTDPNNQILVFQQLQRVMNLQRELQLKELGTSRLCEKHRLSTICERTEKSTVLNSSIGAAVSTSQQTSGGNSNAVFSLLVCLTVMNTRHFDLLNKAGLKQNRYLIFQIP